MPPAASSTPISLPSSSQRSLTVRPRTSVYQDRLFSRSSTVKLGEAVRSCRPFFVDAMLVRWAGRLRAAGLRTFFLAVVVFFLVGIGFLVVVRTTFLQHNALPPRATQPTYNPEVCLSSSSRASVGSG